MTTRRKTTPKSKETPKKEMRRYYGSGVVFGDGKVIAKFDKDTYICDTDDPNVWKWMDKNGFRWDTDIRPVERGEVRDPLYEPPLRVNMRKS